MTLAFTVYGVAQPKGSHRAYLVRTKATGMQVPIVTDSNRSVKAWSQLVAQAAGQAVQQAQTDAALLAAGVRVSLAFYLPRPKTLPKRVQTHTKAPDVDKLSRAVLDALTGIVYRDDSQVVALWASKAYAERGVPRCEITVVPEAEVRVGILPPARPLLEGLCLEP